MSAANFRSLTADELHSVSGGIAPIVPIVVVLALLAAKCQADKAAR